MTGKARHIYHVPPDVVAMTWVMRLLAHGRCYHCRDESRPKPANRFRLRYCPDWQACADRMQAQGKRAVSAGQRTLFEEVPGG